MEQKVDILPIKETKMNEKTFQNLVKVIFSTIEFFISDVQGVFVSLATLWNPPRFLGTKGHVSRNKLDVKI